MDPAMIGLISAAVAVAVAGVTVRSTFLFLERQGDRKLARHVFDQTKSLESLQWYVNIHKSRSSHETRSTAPLADWSECSQVSSAHSQPRARR